MFDCQFSKKVKSWSMLNVTVVIIRNEVIDPSSNPGWGCLYFTWHKCLKEKHEAICPIAHIYVNNMAVWAL